MPSLHILRGPWEGTVIPLGQAPVILGRTPDCEVFIPLGPVSRRHARIVCVEGDYFLDDLESRNGTFLNNKLLGTRTALKNGDRIRIADFIAAFLDPGPAPGTALAEALDPAGDLGGTIALSLSVPPFTQAEWLTAVDPVPMLEFLSTTEAGSERKFRLFVCACARRPRGPHDCTLCRPPGGAGGGSGPGLPL